MGWFPSPVQKGLGQLSTLPGAPAAIQVSAPAPKGTCSDLPLPYQPDSEPYACGRALHPARAEADPEE